MQAGVIFRFSRDFPMQTRKFWNYYRKTSLYRTSCLDILRIETLRTNILYSWIRTPVRNQGHGWIVEAICDSSKRQVER